MLLCALSPVGDLISVEFQLSRICRTLPETSSFRRKPDVARSAENVRRTTPEGVSDVNHPVSFALKSLGPGFRRGDDIWSDRLCGDLTLVRRQVEGSG